MKHILLFRSKEREPTPEELAEALGVAVKDVNQVNEIQYATCIITMRHMGPMG